MRFVFFDHIIGNHQIDLDALRLDTNLYSTLLLQHKGVFFADQHRFGNRDNVTTLFNKFLALAREDQASIAVTPEYSCPWDTVRAVLENPDLRPTESKLWALGCESITPAELRHLQNTYQNENILIVFDNAALDNGINVLLNPLCYIFNARQTDNNAPKLILLIQFKTEHMGVWSNDIEQERYIPGNDIYVLRNNPASMALFTIICSEADTFQVSPAFEAELDHRWHGNSFIILNIQMNPQPSAQFFKTFRNGILRYTNKDILTLNWSSESAKSNGTPLITYSKSSIFYESHQMDFSDEDRFLRNHSLGLYYTNKKQDRHVYFLNGAQNVFLIAHRKPMAGGVNMAMIRRSGPLARNNYSWNADTEEFDPADAMNDGFIDFLNTHGCDNPIFHNPEISVIDKERLITLSIGKIKVKADDRIWHTIDKLHTFFLEDDDIIRRLTFTQDDTGEETRTNYLEFIDQLNTIITTRADLFSPNLVSFPGNSEGAMFPGNPDFNYKYNLATRDGKHKATVAYIGRASLDKAEKVLKSLWEIFDKDDESRKLAIVWYKPTANTIVPVYDIRRPRAAGDNKSKSNAINRQP